MKLKRKHFMIGQEHISKLTRIKSKTGASESHSVRKAISGLREQGSGTKAKSKISRMKKEENQSENREVEREDKKD